MSSRLEDMRQITCNTLFNLKADESLKNKILQKAASETNMPTKRCYYPLPALCSVLAVLMIMIVALNVLQPIPSAGPGEINVFAAGNTDTNQMISVDPVSPIDSIDADSILSIKISGLNPITDQAKCSTLVADLKEHSSSDSALSGLNTENQLIITCSDGTVFKLNVDNPYLFDHDGHCWFCPDFFNEYYRLIE